MGTHAPLAPSAAHRWMRCPGSYEATKGCPETDSVYSREGTFAHDVAAQLLHNGAPAKRAIGWKSKNLEFVVDEKMADAIQVYLSVIRGMLLLDGGELLIEKQVTVTDDVYGTADAVVWLNGRRVLHVVDLKMGAGVLVEVEGNEQLLIYVLGALKEAGVSPREVDEVHMHIVQPRHFGGPPHRPAVVTAAELEAFSKELLSAVHAAKQPGAPLIAGDHCRFCPVRATCPALQTQALTVAQAVFSDLDPKRTVQPPSPANLPMEELAKILPNLAVVEAWIKSVRDHAFHRVLAGETLPGYKLVEKLGNRKWIDESSVAATLQSFGVDPWNERTVISPAEAERRNKAVKATVAKLTTRSPKPLLVPESDKRDAIDSTRAFSILGDEDDESTS